MSQFVTGQLDAPGIETIRENRVAALKLFDLRAPQPRVRQSRAPFTEVDNCLSQHHERQGLRLLLQQQLGVSSRFIKSTFKRNDGHQLSTYERLILRGELLVLERRKEIFTSSSELPKMGPGHADVGTRHRFSGLQLVCGLPLLESTGVSAPIEQFDGLIRDLQMGAP